jgi:hypothetical protein
LRGSTLWEKMGKRYGKQWIGAMAGILARFGGDFRRGIGQVSAGFFPLAVRHKTAATA